jgi:hypothetical protein
MGNESSTLILCPKCQRIKPATKHHVLPLRFFGNRSNILLFLCRVCHDALEEIIPKHNQLPEEEYILIAVEFLGGAYAMRQMPELDLQRV